MGSMSAVESLSSGQGLGHVRESMSGSTEQTRTPVADHSGGTLDRQPTPVAVALAEEGTMQNGTAPDAGSDELLPEFVPPSSPFSQEEAQPQVRLWLHLAACIVQRCLDS